LRNDRSLTQTAGRAARNVNGLVVFYADKITDSMQKTIDETNRRRAKQIAYNTLHDITPKTLSKSKEEIMHKSSILDMRGKKPNYYVESENQDNVAADPLIQYMSRTQLEKLIEETERKMKASAKDLDFISAAKYRDEMQALKKKLPEKLV